MENAVAAVPDEARVADGQNRHHNQSAGPGFDKSPVTGKTASPNPFFRPPQRAINGPSVSAD